MKILNILFVLAFSYFTFSQSYDKIVIEKKSGELQEINLSELKDITFSQQYTNDLFGVRLIDNSIHKFPLSRIKNVDIKNDNLIVNLTDNSINQFHLDSIQRLQFAEAGIEDLHQLDTLKFVGYSVILNNLSNPWGIEFFDSQNAIITEKAGTLWLVQILSKAQGNITKTEIKGVPKVLNSGQGGLLDVKLHPNFHQNKYIYLTYSKSEGNAATTALGRGKLVGTELIDFEELFTCQPAINSSVHYGSRLLFDKEGYLFMTTGERGNRQNAKDSSVHWGKILRLNDDGTVPSDNPFVGMPNVKPEIWSLGHRNVQGIALNPTSGEIWTHEHGPQGGDEINIIKKGAHYGWPLVSFGDEYGTSTPASPNTTLPGYQDPIKYWKPSIAPCGMTFVDYIYPTIEQDLLVGALAGEHINRSIIKDGKVIRELRYFNSYGRVRDIVQSPGGKIYAITESPGTLIELEAR